MRIITRFDWGARAPENVTLSDPKTLKGVVVHWFGIPGAAKSHAGCPALLRSVQNSHMDGEFSDIAYSHATCPHGAVYELRGFGRQTGANGNRTANRDYAAVVYMAGRGDVPTEAGYQALRWIIREWRRKGAGRMVIPHGKITGSECPGPELSLWVARGGFEYPATPPDDPKRLAALRAWILKRKREGRSWAWIKATVNWKEYVRRGGR